MSAIISPNMQLVIPGVGSQLGPQYASDVNNSLTIIDQHNHSSNSGVRITPAGLDINSDLGMGSNNLTAIRSVRFQSQVSAINGPSDVGCLYEVGADLYFNDGAGNQIRITQSGSVSGSSGTITGLPSGTASAAFSAGVFVFQAATNTPANIDGGAFVFRNNVVNSKGLTLSPPTAMGANYALTLPAIPAQTNVMSLDTSGNMGSITYDAVGQGMTSTGANPVANARTRSVGTTVAAGGIALSDSCGNFVLDVPDASYADITNLNVTITTTGRPVLATLVSDGNPAASSFIGAAKATNTFVSARLRLLRDGTTSVSVYDFVVQGASASLININIPGIPPCLDVLSAGTYAYKMQIQSPSGVGTTVLAKFLKLMVYEL